jgi:uncharacterized protein with HEPN domain
MRREMLYLRDILEASDDVQRFVEGLDKATFLTSELH